MCAIVLTHSDEERNTFAFIYRRTVRLPFMIRSIVKPLVGSVTQFVTEESTTDAQQGAVTSLYVVSCLITL